MSEENCFRAFLLYFTVALLSYFFVYGFEITHFTLSIDEEPLDNFAQTLSAGRWGHAMLRHYLLPEPYVPFFTTVLSTVLLSISAALSARFLNFTRAISLSYIVMLVALPQLAYQMEFSNQSDTIGISILCSVSSLFMLRNPNAIKSILFVLFTIASLSIYQSIFLYAASLICIWLALAAYRNEASFFSSLKTLAIFFSLTLFALLINSYLSKLISTHFNVIQSNYLSSMVGWGNNSLLSNIQALSIFIKDYCTFNAAYGMNAFPFCLIWLVGSLFYVVKSRNNVLTCSFYCIASFLSTFLLNIAIGSGMPPRAMTQVPVVFAGLFAIFLVTSRLKYIGLLLPILFLINGSISSNKLFYSDYMARVSDEQLSNKIINTIYNNAPTFDENKTPVFFYGSFSPPNPWKIPTADVFGSSFYSWDGGNNKRIYRYLETANIIKFKIPNQNQVDQAISDAKDMPAWPNRQSVQLKNGVVIIKIGSVLSPYNR